MMTRPSARPALSAACAAWRLLALAALAAAAAPASAESYDGRAYSRPDDRLVYIESHWIYAERGRRRRLVLYRCPDGRPFARKHVDMTPGATVPDFDFEDGRTGYREGVRTEAGRREVFYRMSATSPEHVAALAPRADAVIDAGFDAFVVSHWAGMAAPDGARVSFLVPSRLGYVDFDAEAGAKTATLRRFRLGIAAWYGFALPHIDVAYDRASRRLRTYRGPSNIRDARGHNIDVDIEFPAADWHAEVDMDAVRAGNRATLDGRCETD